MSPLPRLQATALLIPVPEAEPLVSALRREHDPSAAAGVPAHVTVIVPFLGPAELDDDVTVELDKVLAEFPTFPFRLAAVGWFGRSVLYLAPDPALPFVDLTERVAQTFGTAPYSGEFDDIVPHLTVAHASDGVELSSIESRLATGLPVECRAEEVWLMESDAQTWRRRQRFVFRSGGR